MASPALESFCCLIHVGQNNQTFSVHGKVFSDTSLTAYNIICILCGTLGIIGSLYQIFPRRPRSLPQTRKTFKLYVRQNYLICFLALSDLCATLGLVIRSILWLTHVIPSGSFMDILSDSVALRELERRYLTCAITSGWIQYFYICTYLWTLCYALDVYFMLKDKVSYTRAYNLLCWGTSFLVTAGGLIPLYYPSLYRCVYDYIHLIPHFLSAYLPIMVVMIINPILYYKAIQAVKAQVIQRRGQYTDVERFIVTRVRGKFFIVVLVFTVCWSPNIINGLLLALHSYIPADIFIALWMAMAVLNPLQGFLNAMIYRGAGGFNLQLRSRIKSMGSDVQNSDEDSPLLSFRH